MNSTKKDLGGASGAQAADGVTLSFDPTVSQIESHRIVAVLEKSLERLQLLSLLSNEVSEALEAAKSQPGGLANFTLKGTGLPPAGGLGDESSKGVGGILEQQQRLEGRYEELLTLTAPKKHNPLEPKLDNTCFKGVDNVERRHHISELRTLSTNLKEQARQLCSQLRENPNDIDNWSRVVDERNKLIDVLSTCIQEMSTPATTTGTTAAGASDAVDADGMNIPFHITMKYETFARHVLGEQHALQTAEEIVKREKDANQSAKKLHQEVAQEKAKKDAELEARNARLADLKQELRQLKAQTKEDMERVRAETEAKRDASLRAAKDTGRELSDKINHVSEQKDVEVRVSNVVVSHSVSKQDWLDKQFAQWTDKQVKAQKELGEEKHRAEQDRKAAKERLDRALEAKFIEEGEKARREEKAKREVEDKRRRHEQKESEYAACSKMQQAFKAMLARQVIAALKKKAKKRK